MNKNEIQAYLEENFNLSGEACRIINNILDYAECLADDDARYNFFTLMLDGIGLSDNEIKMFA